MSIYKSSSLAMLPTAYKDGKLYSVRPTDGSGDFTFSRGSNLAATRVASSGYIEKGRENLLLQSNQFDTTWTLNNASVSGGQAGYDGTNTAWELERAGTSGFLYQVNAQSGVITFSFYAKESSLSWLRVVVDSGTNADAYINLSDGSVGGGSSYIDVNTYDVGNDWYRISITHNDSAHSNYRIYPAVNDGDISGTSGSIYIQDAQLEQSMVATDYIETGASTAQAGILEDMPRLDYSGGASCPALLLEPQRTNIFNYSEYFGAADWLKASQGSAAAPVVTDNYAISPEGLRNASRVQFDAVGTNSLDRSGLVRQFAFTTGTTYTISCWVKATSGNSELVQFRIAGQQVGGELTATDEWQRLSVTSTASVTTTDDFGLQVRGNNTTNSSDILIYGMQLESASYPTSYIPTYGSSVTRSGENNIITSATDLIGQTEGTMYYEFNSGKNDGADYVVSLSDGSANNRIVIYRSAANQIIAQIRTSAVTYAQLNTSVITENVVYKVALGYANNDVVFYVNGVQIGADTSATIPLTNRIATDNSVGSATFGRPINQLLLFKTRLTNAELAALTTI